MLKDNYHHVANVKYKLLFPFRSVEEAPALYEEYLMPAQDSSENTELIFVERNATKRIHSTCERLKD